MKNQMTKFAMFAYNYPHNFISQVWTGRMEDHMQAKFNEYYKAVGPAGVMVKFYMNLDLENQALLSNFINEYYPG